jgi:hypothetical protein
VRILKKGVFNRVERKRLYKEAKTFLKTRAMRHRWVKDRRETQASATTAASLKA